jgi:iron complex transport system substrate-binding protein
MKKLLQVLLILTLALTMVACGNNRDNPNNSTENKNVDTNNSVVNNDLNSNNDQASEIPEEPSYYPITFVDGMERTVTIESEPMTIVSLAPSMTEMIFAFDLQDRLIGRTDYCDYPLEALEIESVGSLREPNIEAIIGMNPDLVLMSTHASEEVLAFFEEADIKVAILTAQDNFEGVYDIMTQVGMVFNLENEGVTMIDNMKNEVAQLTAAVEDVTPQSVYYVVGYGESDWTATGDTFIHQMLEMAGGKNIAAEATGWSYNLETIIEKDPYYIICSELFETKEDISSLDGYKDLTAVKEGRLLTIDPDLLSIQGPRLAEGLRALIELMHPDALDNLK